MEVKKKRAVGIFKGTARRRLLRGTTRQGEGPFGSERRPYERGVTGSSCGETEGRAPARGRSPVPLLLPLSGLLAVDSDSSWVPFRRDSRNCGRE